MAQRHQDAGKKANSLRRLLALLRLDRSQIKFSLIMVTSKPQPLRSALVREFIGYKTSMITDEGPLRELLF